MSTMAEAITPRSDQLNSDDLIAGPITITITDVTIRGGQEQPVSIHYEGDKGKPYKSCKSMNRVLVTCWGADAKQYVGRSLTLYRDPEVKWGGMAVGGIRISHLSHIDSPITMALTATKGSRKPYTVKPIKSSAPQPTSLADVAPPSEAGGADLDDPTAPARLTSADTLKKLGSIWNALSIADKKELAPIKDTRKAELQAPKDDFAADYDSERAGMEGKS